MSHGLRAADRLSAALRLLRYRLRVHWRPANVRLPTSWPGGGLPGPARVRHRWRAAGAARLPRAADCALRCRATGVSLETSGALDIAAVDPSRGGGAGPEDAGLGRDVRAICWSNLPQLKRGRPDQVRDLRSRLTTSGPVRSCGEQAACHALRSAVFASVGAAAGPGSRRVDPGRPVAGRFQVQLHKYLWGNEPGH